MIESNIAKILESGTILQEITIKGWVRTFRSNRFIAVNDGSTIKNIQCVIDFENTPEDLLKRITYRCCYFRKRNCYPRVKEKDSL